MQATSMAPSGSSSIRAMPSTQVVTSPVGNGSIVAHQHPPASEPVRAVRRLPREILVELHAEARQRRRDQVAVAPLDLDRKDIVHVGAGLARLFGNALVRDRRAE